MSIRIMDIVDGTSVDGPGLRTAIYTAGCAHACPGCHNPSTWPFDAGRDASVDEPYKLHQILPLKQLLERKARIAPDGMAFGPYGLA